MPARQHASTSIDLPAFQTPGPGRANGDLALALTIDQKYDFTNPFRLHAKYRWTAPDFADYGEAFDLVQLRLCERHNVSAPNWRSILRIRGNWQGRIRTPEPQPGSGSILLFCRWLLLQGLQQDNILDRYDRFVVTRSDFVWLCPHPPLSVLDRGAIWFPNGEHYGGFTDRHLVVSRADVVSCLNLIEDILLHPVQLYDEMKHRPTWNIEQFLAYHLSRRRLSPKVKLFPYVMYTARSAHDDYPTRSRGHGYYEPALGHYVKYREEFRTASAYSTIIRSRADWENAAWIQSDFGFAVRDPVSLPRLPRHVWERFYYHGGPKVWSALRRPGRVGRFVRFCNRMVRRTVGRRRSKPGRGGAKNEGA